MGRSNRKTYNLKPRECFTPEFYYYCVNSGSPILQLINFAQPGEPNFQVDKSLFFSFYINNHVDLHSLLKTIVLLAKPDSIQYENNSFFNPTNVSVDSILNNIEAISYTYSLSSEKYFNGKFYLKINQQDNEFTKISIQAYPFQIALMLKLIHYLGGYIKGDFKDKNPRLQEQRGFHYFKFSQQGKWKANFTKKKLESFYVPQKEQFFKAIQPISMADVASFHSKEELFKINRVSKCFEQIAALAEAENIVKTFEEKQALEKILNKKAITSEESDIITYKI